jgi:hypothetical protein
MISNSLCPAPAARIGFAHAPQPTRLQPCGRSLRYRPGQDIATPCQTSGGVQAGG